MGVTARSLAIREAWVRARNAFDLRTDWATAIELLNDAIDEHLDPTLLVRFAEAVHLLADAIADREALIDGRSGLTLDLALKVADEVLLARHEQARYSEVLDALVRLADDDDHRLDDGLALMVLS